MSGGFAAAGLAMAAIGTAVSVSGQMQQASAAKAAANYQSEVAAGNATIATQNANMAAQSGETQAAAQEQKTRQQVGAITAAEGSSGVDINSPTATAVRTSQSELGALDAQTIRSNAARTAYGYQVQAAGFQDNAAADITTGQNAQTAGDVGAISSGLSGVGNAGLNFASVMNKSSGIDSNTSLNEGSVDNAALNQTMTGTVGGGL